MNAFVPKTLAVLLLAVSVAGEACANDGIVSLWETLPAAPHAPSERASPPGLTSMDSLARVAGIPPAQAHHVVFGDTDHDGFNEVILWWHDSTPTSSELYYRILEERGENVYSTEFIGPNLLPYATGDLDGDGKSEIIGQFGGWIQVYESTSLSTYPTQLVWSSPQMVNVANIAAVGDTDRDGRMEILHSENSFAGNGNILHIFENDGDDSYREVLAEPIPKGGTASKIIADFDGDGLVEIAFFSGSHVYVYESPADDVWRLAWSDSTELRRADASGGIDTDGNGRPELFVTGNGPAGFTTIVFEAACDDVWTRITSFTPGIGDSPFKTLARLDGDSGPVSFLMSGYQRFWIYRPVAEGTWELVGEFLDPDRFFHSGLHAFDVNRNGRDEVFWTTEGLGFETLVLEKPDGTTAAPLPAAVGLRLSIAPNPLRYEGRLMLPAPWNRLDGRLTVYDASGRLVQRLPHLCDASGAWIWSTAPLSAGIYFVRLVDGGGRLLGMARATVIR